MSVAKPIEYTDALLSWVSILTGIESKRVVDALQCVRGWKISHVTRLLVDTPSIDHAVASVLLVEGISKLTARSIPETKLLSKLRRDPDFWPAWVEIRAATLLARLIVPDGQIAVEAFDASVTHPDFVITGNGGSAQGVECKAIGLSDAEVDFCRRMNPALDALIPAKGLVTLHAYLDTVRVDTASLPRAELDADAAATADDFPHFPEGLAGVVVVGHRGEVNYRRRAWVRIRDEICSQLQTSEGGWAALHWNNGTNVTGLTDDVDWDALPGHLEGIILFGDAVAFPQPELHSFCFILPRGSGREGQMLFESSVDKEFAKRLFDRFDRSSGVRPMVLVDQATRVGGLALQLLRRDFRNRIVPFNFLVDADPENIANIYSGRRLGDATF